MAADDVKITLYWLEQSRSQRILWLLEELKVKYDVKTYPRVNQLAPEDLKKIHPLGKSPAISIEVPGQAKPIVLVESGFITEYLIDHFAPHLAPEKYAPGQEGKVGGETESWMRYRHLLHYNEGTLMPFLVMKLITENIRKAPVPFFIRPITNRVAAGIEDQFVHPNIANNLKFLEGLLATSPEGGKYITGPKLTGVDILLSFPLIAAKSRIGVDAKKYPNLVAYTALLEKEPGYIEAVKKIEAIDGKKYSVVQG